jgi:hypothetical protein
MKLGEVDDILAVLAGVLASLYLIYCIIKAIFKYKSFGLWFKLIIGVEIGIAAFVVS